MRLPIQILSIVTLCTRDNWYQYWEVALSTAGWDQSALRRERLHDQDIGPILKEVETGQRPEWKDIADRSLTYKSYWAQWKSLAVRNGILERHWECFNGRLKIAQIIHPRSRVNAVLTELQGGPSRGHLAVNKTVDKVRQMYSWLQARNDVEEWCRQCEICAAGRGPLTRNRSRMGQYNVGALFGRITIDVAGFLPRSDQGNRYLVIAMDPCGLKPTPFLIKRLRQLWKRWLPTSSASSEYRGSYIVTRAVTSSPVPIHEVLECLEASKTRTMPLHPQSDGGGAVNQNCRGAAMKSRRIAPEGLGRKITRLPPCLLRHCRLDPR
jgi:hypothetical protein